MSFSKLVPYRSTLLNNYTAATSSTSRRPVSSFLFDDKRSLLATTNHHQQSSSFRKFLSTTTKNDHSKHENENENENNKSTATATKNYGPLIGLALAIASSALIYATFTDHTNNKNEHAQEEMLKRLKKSFLPKQRTLHAKELPPTNSNDYSNDRAIVITGRQRLFFQFASIEYEGIPYMTPQDFLESVTEDHPRPRMRRKMLSQANYKTYLKNTPQLSKGSTRFFRNLEEKGLISYSEYLFLLCVLTKPKSSFQIAFNMFDTDGNQRVDKKEFLVRNSEQLDSSFLSSSESGNGNSKRSNNNQHGEALIDRQLQSIIILKDENNTASMNTSSSTAANQIDPVAHIDTTLLVHLFGRNGNNLLTFEQFKKFMEDLQIEVLEIEFNEFSKGMNKISSIDFAEIMLRYTNFDHNKRSSLLKKLPMKMDAYSREISFEKFLQFNAFMNNLSDFALALKFHTLANKSISVNEFQRAVRISSGFELDPQIVQVIFAVFDQDGDGQLSYKEFIAVLKDRLRRGLKGTKDKLFENGDDLDLLGDSVSIDMYTNGGSSATDKAESYADKMRKCIRTKLRNNKYS